jgi:PAS domain S-box-containing protein
VSDNEVQRTGAKILVVEDSPTQALMLKHLLETNSYEVLVAKSGKEALEALAVEIPALIISDIVMPEMDGYELTLAVKNDLKLRDIPVILLTALSDPEDVIKGLEARGDFYLTKPYDEDFLLSKVGSVIAGRAHRKIERALQEIEVNLWGKTYSVTVEPERSLSLLASTYENAIQINRELKKEIAERKKVEEKLRVTVNKLKEMEAIIEISPAVAFIKKAEEKLPVVFVSDNVLQFDYESEDLLSGQMSYVDIIHPDDKSRILEEIAKYSADKDVEEFSLEYRIVTGYGDTRWVDDRTFVRRNSKGAVTHYQGIIIDVTERKESEGV